jgi:hypothetical protein
LTGFCWAWALTLASVSRAAIERDNVLFMVYSSGWLVTEHSFLSVSGSRRANGLKFHEIPLKKSENV